MNKLEGTYKGEVLNWPLGWLWQGKVFTRSDFNFDQVINRILWFEAVRGKVIYCSNCIKIVYPFGLTDTLIPITDYYYLGMLHLGRYRVFFSLTKMEDEK